MSLFTLWLVFVLPEFVSGIQALSVIGLVILAVVFGVMGLAVLFEDMKPETYNTAWSKVKGIAIAAVLLAILGGMVPSTDAMKYIIGGYFVTNIETIDQLPPNIVKAANKFLEEYSGEIEK